MTTDETLKKLINKQMGYYDLPSILLTGRELEAFVNDTRADERRKLGSQNTANYALGVKDGYAKGLVERQKTECTKHGKVTKRCAGCSLESEKEQYAKGKADVTLLFQKLAASQYEAGQADLIEKLDKKMGLLSLSGGAYGQLDGEETETTRTISQKDWAAIKTATSRSSSGRSGAKPHNEAGETHD
jgi:hypothetical protein